jgi:hypothetical protein
MDTKTLVTIIIIFVSLLGSLCYISHTESQTKIEVAKYLSECNKL